MMRVRVGIIAALSIALWFGTKRFGLIGAITVVVLFNLVERCLIAFKVGRILGVTRRDVGLLKDVGKVAAAALAGAIAAWVVRSYGPNASPLVLLVLCGIAFVLAYGFALVLLGVFTPEERDIVERRLGWLPRFSWTRTPGSLADTNIMSVGYGSWSAQPVPAAFGPASPILTRNATTAREVGELTERKYWDLTHISEREFWESEPARRAPSMKRFLKSSIKTILGKRLLDYMGSYEEYLLWNVIYEKHLPKRAGAKVLEVGSAPGDFLVKLSNRFDFVPYGIEYSDNGVDLNRKIFAENNINPGNVVHGDFLSDEFHRRYQGQFDIVISRGFVEHFTDAKGIVEKHLNLLAKGGVLMISIPNLNGFNYLLARTFHKEAIAMHNLTIMQESTFKDLFNATQLSPIFCNYYGTFNFGLFNTGNNSLLRSLLGLCMKLQIILNVAFRLLLGERGAESRFFSPSLIYIGLKNE
jgi:2-polyprenyl-3-methyl-5-hydroxy-6-metoxy-1,4-benzoquinol methylase